MVAIHRRWAAVLALSAIAAGGCAAPATGTSPGGPGPVTAVGPPVVAQDASNGHRVTLQVGQRLELILASTYWTVQGSSVPRVLHQDGPSSRLARSPGCGSIPGMGCVPIRTDFSALAPGTAVITASRLSCGEAMRCPPGKQHFTLTVVVR